MHELKAALTARGAGLHVLYGRARNEIPRLARRLGVAAAYANRDDEPQAIARDVSVAERLREAGIDLRTCKDQVIFELSVIASPSCAFWDLNLQAMSLMPAPYGRSVKRSSGAGCALGEKSGQPHYGYKDHINDQATKLIAAQACTDASVHDSQVLETRATR